MITKRELLDYANNLGITKIGFTSLDRLSNLPIGKILDVAEHIHILDILPTAKSLIVLAYKIWDPIFNVVAMGPSWEKKGTPLDLILAIVVYIVGASLIVSTTWFVLAVGRYWYLRKKGRL